MAAEIGSGYREEREDSRRRVKWANGRTWQ